MAFGWMAPASTFGSVVRKAERSVSPSSAFRTDVQFVQMPAKQASGRGLPGGEQCCVHARCALVAVRAGQLTMTDRAVI